MSFPEDVFICIPKVDCECWTGNEINENIIR